MANRALAEVAPFVKLVDSSFTNDEHISGLVKSKMLPIWFGVNETDAGHENVICFLGDSKETIPGILVRSPSERDYLLALEAQRGHRPEVLPGPKEDYAIISRITATNFVRQGDGLVRETGGDTRKILIIAGLHQYGTWIAGEFFSRIATGRAKRYADEILQSDDFAFVVWGKFDPERLEVGDCEVRQHDFWQYTGDTWRRVMKE
jgi:hypothetical protein